MYHKSIKEALGTIQYKNKNLNKLLTDIVNDIFNHDNNLSYELIYDNINKNYNIDWIKKLIIIIKNNVFSSNDAIALIDDDKSTIYNKTNKTLELGTIIVINPLQQYILKSNIAHELNHYLKYLYINVNDKHVNDNDLIYISSIKYMKIDFKKEFKIIKNYILNFDKSNFLYLGKLKSFYLETIYYMNKSELNAHMENLYGEILKNKQSKSDKLENISDTYLIYKYIQELLNFLIDDNVNNDFKQFIQRTIKPIFDNTIGTNISFRKAILRLINRNKTFINKANKLYFSL